MCAEISAEMAEAGWRGGQGVQYSRTDQDIIQITLSDGYFCGFMLRGSNEPGDGYTGLTDSAVTYRIGTFGAGGWIIMTSTYEKYTWESRQAHELDPNAPLEPIVYHASDRLIFSNRGWWTTEDEWSLSGDPRAPNNYYIAFIAQAPSEATKWYMTIQVSI